MQSNVSLFTKDKHGNLYQFGKIKVDNNGKVLGSFGRLNDPSGKKVVIGG